MNKKTALMYAVDLLARQEQSEKRLREKLQRFLASEGAPGFAAQLFQRLLVQLLPGEKPQLRHR